jgi:hypothetical protein
VASSEWLPRDKHWVVNDTTHGPRTRSCLTYLRLRGGALPTSPSLGCFAPPQGNEGPEDHEHSGPSFHVSAPGRPQLCTLSHHGSGHSFGKMGEKPAPTPQALRDQAQQAIRLANGITDKQAKTALLAFAQELLQKAPGWRRPRISSCCLSRLSEPQPLSLAVPDLAGDPPKATVMYPFITLPFGYEPSARINHERSSRKGGKVFPACQRGARQAPQRGSHELRPRIGGTRLATGRQSGIGESFEIRISSTLQLNY